jgi:hypothetical protein
LCQLWAQKEGEDAFNEMGCAISVINCRALISVGEDFWDLGDKNCIDEQLRHINSGDFYQ